MAVNYGKAWESQVKEAFLRLPGATIDRIYDVTMGYRNISNICDFIGFVEHSIYYIEAKSHAGASFPFDKLTQYDKLIEKVGIPGVRAGVLLWLYDKQVVLYVPIKTVRELKEHGEKSVGIRHLKDKEYRIIEIPGEKKRVFIDCDFSELLNLEDGD